MNFEKEKILNNEDSRFFLNNLDKFSTISGVILSLAVNYFVINFFIG